MNAYQSELVAAALQYLKMGISVLPTRKDKKPMMPWARLQHERATEEEVWAWASKARFEGIGIILGAVSGNVLCRDYDQKGAYEAWTEGNPDLCDCLPTVRTARGEHVYLRTDEICRTKKFDDGELRGENSYAIAPPSIHPSGEIYKWLTPMPMFVAEIPICDSHDFYPPIPQHMRTQENTDTQEEHMRTQVYNEDTGIHRNTQDDTCGLAHSRVCASIKTIDQIVESGLPSASRRNHHAAFQLGRGCRTFEKNTGRLMTDDEKELVAELWLKRVDPSFLRRDPNMYRDEIHEAIENAMHPFGETGLAIAKQRAMKNPPPKEAEMFSHPKYRLAVGVCWELQKMHGNKPFHLSCRALQATVEFESADHNEAAKVLRYLVKKGVLTLVKKGSPGTRGDASQYRFVGAVDGEGENDEPK